jgi:Spy/CpxP family protein refolding chaperone
MKQLLAVVLIAALSTVAYAQPAPGPGRDRAPHVGQGFHGGPGGVMAKLNLTEDQQAQVEKLRLDLQKKQVALRSKVDIARLEIKEMFNAPSPDRSAIEKKMKEVSDLQFQQKLNGLDHLFAVKTILTPEQQKLWKEHMKGAGMEARERLHERRGW